MGHTFDQSGDCLTVHVDGKLDITSSPALEEQLAPQLEGVGLLILDLARVDYVSSMGLRLLLALQKRMAKQGAMRVANVNPQVMDLFEETGFSEILTIV